MSPLRRSVRQDFRIYERRLGPAKLYLDDIEDIVRSLREVTEEAKLLARKERHERLAARIRLMESDVSDTSTPVRRREVIENVEKALQKNAEELDETLERDYRVEIKASDALADDVDDLRSTTKDDLDRIRITTYRPHVAIQLQRTGARVLTFAEGEGDEREARLLVDDVATFIKRRRVFLVRPSTPVIFYLVLALLAVLVGILLAVTDADVSSDLVELGILIIGAAPFVFGFEQLNSYQSGSVIVIPERRSERRGLSATSRRDATIAIVGAAIGAILGTIGTFLVEKLTK